MAFASSAPVSPVEPRYAASYEYGYEVNDEYTGTKFGAKEGRQGYNTNGEYHVDLPDGRTQIVTYNVADEHSGFVADVRYEGNAYNQGYEPVPATYKPAPATYKPAPKPHHVQAPYKPAPKPHHVQATYKPEPKPINVQAPYKPAPKPHHGQPTVSAQPIDRPAVLPDDEHIELGLLAKDLVEAFSPFDFNRPSGPLSSYRPAEWYQGRPGYVHELPDTIFRSEAVNAHAG